MKAAIFSAKACHNCGRIPQVGNRVSHAMNRTKRLVELNLQVLGGQRLCTRCRRTMTKHGGRLVRRGTTARS